MSVLAVGKAKEIEKIIELLKKEEIDVKNCLTVLAEGKAKEIEKIIKLLKKEKIDVRNCLTILARGKADEIELKLKLLKDENIYLSSVINNKLFYIFFVQLNYIELSDIIDKEKKGNLDDEQLKIMFKIRDMNNKFYSKGIIEDYCKKYNITLERFLELFTKYDIN